jgi:putative zinc finger/helix-turn-helix YgiT family protein
MTDNTGVTGVSEPEVSCGQCGSTRLARSIQNDAFTYGQDANAVELSVLVPVYSCQECGFSFTTDVAERIRHEAVCRHLGVLTPVEIRNIRSQIGMTRERFATLTGIGTASLARWETGELIQGGGYDKYLRLLVHADNLERLERGAKNTAHVTRNVVQFGDKTKRHPFRALIAAGRYEEHVVAASSFSLMSVGAIRQH